MTLEEAKKLADNGNVQAMLALAKFYDQQDDNEESGDLAKHYYCCAAEAGDLSAIRVLAQSSHTAAKAMMALPGSFSHLLPCFEDAYKWNKALFELCNQLNIQGEAAEYAFEFYLDAIVWLSAAYNMDDNYAEIKRITDGVDHPVAKAIHGMALHELANTNAEIVTAFDFLKNAMHSSFWEKKYATPDTLEVLQATVGMALSTGYRVYYNNLEAAYNVLAMMLGHLNDADLREVVQKHISRYKKTLFGGLKYIE